MNLLEVASLSVTSSDGVARVRDVSFTVAPGERLGLIGESGSGKSLTAFAVIGLLPAGLKATGSVMLDDTQVVGAPEKNLVPLRGRVCSFIFQEPLTALDPLMKLGHQLAEPIARHQGLRGSALKRAVLDALDEVHLPEPERIADSRSYEISGGQRQRVAIAMALACRPRLLIADEPTTALDVTVQAQILRLLKELVSDLQSSLLLITHDLGIVAELCDRVYVIYCGKVVEHGDVYQIFETPRHPYTIGLLRSALSIEEMKDDLVTIEGQVPNLMAPPSGCTFHPRCAYCMDICRLQVPEPVAVGEGHHVWCFREMA
jgi:peptide/nickel transport system ATP-binding protein